VRVELRKHQLKRIEQRRFRRHPERYLAELKAQFLMGINGEILME
jgi:hypothetical protein